MMRTKITRGKEDGLLRHEDYEERGRLKGRGKGKIPLAILEYYLFYFIYD